MAIKTPSLSPYAYCAANPVMNVDPTGKDIWLINEKGEVVEWIEAKEYDRFEFIDDDGNIRINSDGEEQVLQFGYGTVSNYRKEKYANLKSINYGNQSGEADIFEIKGDKAGTATFEMFAQNVTGITNNEVALIRTGAIGKNERNFITSGHQPNTETGTVPLFNGQLCNGYYIREHIHSHSTKSYPSPGDNSAKLEIQGFLYDSYGYIASFWIYHVPSKKYYPY